MQVATGTLPQLVGGGCRFKFRQDDIEILGDNFFGFFIAEIADGSLAHGLQGNDGSRRRTSVLDNFPQSPHVHGDNIGVAGNDGVGDVAQEPAQVPQRLGHVARAVAGDVDRSKPCRNRAATRGEEELPQTAEDTAAAAATAATATFRVGNGSQRHAFLGVHVFAGHGFHRFCRCRTF